MSETRILILADDGRHATVGRQSRPTEAEISAAAGALAAQGIGAWLVEATGHLYGGGEIELRALQRLSGAPADFVTAAAAFHALRKAAAPQ